MKKSLIILPFIALLLSCGKSPQNNLESTNDTLVYAMKSFEKHSKTCVSEDSLCATVKFEYPEFDNADFNDVIKKEIINVYHDDSDSSKNRPNNFEELAKPFVEDYDVKLKEGKDYVNQANAINEGGFLATPWNMEAYTTVQRQTAQYIMLHTNTNWFMGGAHPISMEYYYIYDRHDFKRVKLEDLFKPNFDKKLLTIAEAKFRSQERLKPADKLTDENGYFFEKGRFILNDNFTLTQTGIKFLYNVYEIKSYAAGITELEIPYSDLKEILK
jgi:hypothetical protein